MHKQTSTNIPAAASHIAELEHERLTALINSMADGVIAVDELGIVAIYNGAALNILDINSELRGKNIADIIKLVDKNDHKVNIERLIKQCTTQLTSRDLRLKYANKEIINLYLSVAPVHLGFGIKGQRGHVILMRDITSEKSLEEERDEFISVISHELRTPVAIAEGNLGNTLFIAEKQSKMPDQILKSIQAAYDQIVYLASMINDLSTLSRAERGKLNIEPEPINASELLSELKNNYQSQAKTKHLELLIHPDPALKILNSSKLYVREILQNFVTNAIKYTEKGKVLISAKQSNKGIIFEVSDTGIGLSKSDKSKIFEKFFRSEDYRTRQNNGTGLGLYVTAKLAEMLHANITVESELNKGSTFIIEIPNIENHQADEGK